MATFNREYTEAIVNYIREFLESEEARAHPRDFVIKLDGEQLFPKTSNLSMFDSYKSFLNPTTRTVTFLIYKGTSQHNDKYVLTYNSPAPQPQTEPGLSGPDLEEEFSTRLRLHEDRKELGKLRKDNGKLRRKLKKKKRKIGNLEEAILEMRTTKYKLGKLNLGELSSIALEGVMRRNTHWLKGLPMGSALAGVIEADNERFAEGQNTEAAPEGEASFEREAGMGNQAGTEASAGATSDDPLDSLSAEQLFDLNIGGAIRRAFSEKEDHTNAISILKMLSHRKDLMGDVIDMLKSEMPDKKG